MNRNIYRQILVAVVANISCLSFGTSFGWTSPNIPKLQDSLLIDSPLDRVITANEVGWIGSLVAIAGFISPFFAGILASKFGRKFVLLTSGFNLGASYVILSFAKIIGLIYLARFMQGISVGLTMTTIPMYIGEIAEDSLRGALGTLMFLFLNVGILFSYCIGPYVTYSTFQYLCLIFPAIFVVLFMFMPESPTYSVKSGNRVRAISSLMYLRNASEATVLPEIELIEQTLNQSENAVKGSWKNLFKIRGNVRALVICVGLMLVTQFSGINPIVYFAQSIFERAGGDVEPKIAAIIVGGVIVVVASFSPYLIEPLGRKNSLIISGIGVTIGSALLSIYFFLDDADAAESISFLPLTSLMIYLAFFFIGFGSVPWSMVGELFAADIRAYGITITSALSSLFATVAIQFFEPLNESIGPQWTFAIFALSGFIGVVFAFFIVIETKGLSLLQIQERLNQ